MLGCLLPACLSVCKLVVEVGAIGAVGGWDCADFLEQESKATDFECLGVCWLPACLSAS